MPQVIVTRGAADGMERCRLFLRKAGADVARRAATAISREFARLEDTPLIGRAIPDGDGLRELLVPFGDSGYVALYRFQPSNDTIYVLAFRHQRESGY